MNDYTISVRHLGELSAGTIVEVQLAGSPANVMIMTANGYLNYARGQHYQYIGKRPLTQKLYRIEITEANDYYFIVDMANIEGRSNTKCRVIKPPLLFLSHCSKDKFYGDIIREFVIGLGVRDDQLIYTSHPMNKIPLDANIFDYLKSNLNKEILALILLSRDYFGSPACLSEMGAIWVNSKDYTLLAVPDFKFNDKKYQGCPIDKDQYTAVLNGNDIFRANMLELKDKIINLFELASDEKKTANLIQNMVDKIANGRPQ